jgi:hypothetical protein
MTVGHSMRSTNHAFELENQASPHPQRMPTVSRLRQRFLKWTSEDRPESPKCAVHAAGWASGRIPLALSDEA